MNHDTPDDRTQAQGTADAPTAPDGGTRSEREEVVIIGSGVGGSIAAFRLAEAGVANVVLDRGRRWPITPAGDTFPTFPSPDSRLVWLDDDSTPLPPAGGPLCPCSVARSRRRYRARPDCWT